MTLFDSDHFLEQSNKFVILHCAGKKYHTVLTHLVALLSLLNIVLQRPHCNIGLGLFGLQLLVVLGEKLEIFSEVFLSSATEHHVVE